MKIEFDYIIIGVILIITGLSLFDNPLQNYAIKGVGILILFSLIIGFVILLIGVYYNLTAQYISTK